MRAVDSGDILTQPGDLYKRLPTSTRRDDFVYIVYEDREMD